MKNKLLPLLAVSALLASLTACSAGRPNSDELTQALTSKNAVIPVPPEQADCVAKKLIASDLSNETLQAIVHADKTYTGSEKEQSKLVETLTAAQTACNA